MLLAKKLLLLRYKILSQRPRKKIEARERKELIINKPCLEYHRLCHKIKQKTTTTYYCNINFSKNTNMIEAYINYFLYKYPHFLFYRCSTTQVLLVITLHSLPHMFFLHDLLIHVVLNQLCCRCYVYIDIAIIVISFTLPLGFRDVRRWCGRSRVQRLSVFFSLWMWRQREENEVSEVNWIWEEWTVKWVWDFGLGLAKHQFFFLKGGLGCRKFNVKKLL